MSGLAVQAGKRPSYPAHKPSSVTCLGDVPEHWELLAFKRLGDFQAGAGFPNDEQGFDDEELPFYKVSDTNLPGNEVFMNAHNNAVSHETALRLRAYVFPQDTIVFAKVGAALLLNKRRILTRPSCIDNNMMGFIRKSCDRNWAYYWMCSLDLGDLANPGAVPSINEGQIREIRVPVPPLDEQRAIAAFLDRETARIDVLIEKKRRQIELLHEKRAALICHAVTKGLDPNAPMKDSGIDWLSQVPAQWQHRKLRYLVTMEGGCTPSKSNPEYWIGDIPWVSPKDMKTRVVSESEDHVSEDAVRESSLRLLDPPVVLMVVRGMILAHTFPVALTAVSVTINQDMKALRPKPGCSAQYLTYLLEGISSLILSLVEESAHGTKCLRTEIWKGINLFLPSPAEQADICEELDRHNERLSLLVGRISLSFDRLREYRTALISAAVTGKIDVREAVA